MAFRTFPLRLVANLMYQVFFQCLLLPSQTIKSSISSPFPFAHCLQSHIFVLYLLEAGNDTLLLSDGLHGFTYKSVELKNYIINLCHVSEIYIYILPLLTLP